MTEKKMRVETRGGINWVWFKVQNGNLVAVFRLHYGEEPLAAFNKLKKGMVKAEHIDVPFATWREKCTVIAGHTSMTTGYHLPEVIKAFGWLDKMYEGVADEHESEACYGRLMRHLEYHGVTVCKI